MPLLSKIIVPGRNALKETIRQMNYLEQLSFKNTDFVKFVFEHFHSDCLPCIPGKIWNFMRNNFQYVSDDPFDEYIIAPYLMPEILKGDCDDFALFSKSCLDILGGFNTNYILFAKEKNNFSHVATFCNRGVFNNTFNDPVIIDGANINFNVFPPIYPFYKLI